MQKNKNRVLAENEYHGNGASGKDSAASKRGILLVNLGTPDAPTPKALRKYLKQFLSDGRVVEFPRWLWKIVLHGIILRLRPKKSAALYKSIWTEAGSPLLVHSRQQQKKLQASISGWAHVELAMRYGQPSISSALQSFKEKNISDITVIPLFPQYCGATTGSIFDALADELKQWRWVPNLKFVSTWHDQPLYINALAASIQRSFDRNGKPQRLLFSFHGTPKAYFEKGDPYYCYCQKNARLVAEKLQLNDDEYLTVFQSRFGKLEWLQPYTDLTLQALPAQGITDIAICCPAFVADCLETLEEIKVEGRDTFLNAGGENFQYIDCLNDDDALIAALQGLSI